MTSNNLTFIGFIGSGTYSGWIFTEYKGYQLYISSLGFIIN